MSLPAPSVLVVESEVEFVPIRAQGPGGQNVNKVSCAVHLYFDVRASSLPEPCKAALLAARDQRVSRDGVVVIKAQAYRSAALNRQDALERLQEMVDEAARIEKPRKASKPTYGSKQRRLAGKALRGKVKQLRGKVDE
ncbi:alternative ribosome rescue aminoacyl-tRNA hydrolase ArfB [Chitinimonas koreensis]|uniref:alternative ribosome rescue aminoacyl-tRNA hydrolase ArfB n=1 Tax=Chitinimonas koreensis TaxID=356302 RepID=UPI000429767D|nr:alternative ribosome rescue aminoacyl-tRNA hydrolase ArfB [Chitinimonas koreensis]QNM96803.1 aminoacyl-tRNA hydrolase [Chitinimonas koreensis]